MQEHIEWLKENQLYFNIPIEVIENAEDLLEKEKEQIMAAVRYGQNNHTENVYEEGELYYNEIYNSDAPFIKSSIPKGNIEVTKTNNL